MLGLPKATEINKQLPKKAIYAKFQMNTAAKERMDKDISRLYIVNEVSAAKINVSDGAEIKSFFVLAVQLKTKEYDEKNITMLSKLIPQKMVLLLEFENEARLAVYHSKLLQSSWQAKDSLNLELKGLDLDQVWENIIIQISGLKLENGNTIAEQIKIDEQRAKLQKEIARLEKLARAERQPKKKFELVQQLNKFKQELEGR